MIEPYRRRGRLAFDHEQLAEALARERRAQLERRDEFFEASRDIVKRRLVAIGEALDQARIAEERFPTVLIIALKLGRVLEDRP